MGEHHLQLLAKQQIHNHTTHKLTTQRVTLEMLPPICSEHEFTTQHSDSMNLEFADSQPLPYHKTNTTNLTLTSEARLGFGVHPPKGITRLPHL